MSILEYLFAICSTAWKIEFFKLQSGYLVIL
jgi:hypothetical protein